MNKIIKLISAAAASLFLAGCVEVAHDDDTYIYQHDDNAVEKFVLREVLEIDPTNPTGVDIMSEFDEFATLSLTISYQDGKIAYAEFDNGQLPFYPGLNTIPSGKQACTYDSSVYPPVLKLADGTVLAKMVNNEPIFEFSLDYKKISYKYSFKAEK